MSDGFEEEGKEEVADGFEVDGTVMDEGEDFLDLDMNEPDPGLAPVGKHVIEIAGLYLKPNKPQDGTPPTHRNVSAFVRFPENPMYVPFSQWICAIEGLEGNKYVPKASGTTDVGAKQARSKLRIFLREMGIDPSEFRFGAPDENGRRSCQAAVGRRSLAMVGVSTDKKTGETSNQIRTEMPMNWSCGPLPEVDLIEGGADGGF